MEILRTVPCTLLLFFKKLILEREEGGKRERNIDLLFQLFMHSLVDSYMCPGWELNPQTGVAGRH